MYTAFYGLREKPFALVPDPRYLYLSASHREALAHLLYGIDEGEGFIAVTGEVGTGKTTICRTLLERLGAETEVAFLFNPSLSGIELLQDISAEFGLETEGRNRSDLAAQLNRFLLKKREDRRRVLLIIDEAQNLSEDTLEQVRLLSNLETSSSKLIQILLLGQPELDAKLDSPELRQLRQRISVRWGLGPLSARETRDYVRHRLQVAAGAERTIFTDAALREVHRRTGGVPRLVNVLCDRALLAGYVEKAPTIGPAIVKKAAREIPDAAARGLFAGFRRAPAVARARLSGIAIGFAAMILLVLAAGFVLRPLLGKDPDAGGLAAVAPAPVSAVGQPAGPPTVEVRVELPVSELDVEASGEALAGGAAPVAAAPPLTARGPAAPPPATPPPATPRTVGPPADGDFLALALADQSASASREDAVNALLRSFGLAPYRGMLENDAAALEVLEARGLGVLPIGGARLETLRALNHPALLRVEARGEEPRLLALRQLEGPRVWLYGLSGDTPLRLPEAELDARWTGEAWVVWREFEEVRPVLAYGHRGPEVSWLQTSLATLGYYGGEPSGLFDGTTREGVRALQEHRNIPADGIAGPRTRMVLYDLLGSYAVPRLVARPEPQPEPEPGENAG